VADRLSRLGANQINSEGRGRSRRQLCPDRSDRQGRTGLFDEVRKYAGAATAAGGRSQGGAAPAAGVTGTAEWAFRLVLRSEAARPVGNLVFRNSRQARYLVECSLPLAPLAAIDGAEPDHENDE